MRQGARAIRSSGAECLGCRAAAAQCCARSRAPWRSAPLPAWRSLGADGVGKTLLAHSAAEAFAGTVERGASGWWAPRPSESSRSAHSEPCWPTPTSPRRADRPSCCAPRRSTWPVAMLSSFSSSTTPPPRPLVRDTDLSAGGRRLGAADRHRPGRRRAARAVAALWADELLDRVEVGPLDAAATKACWNRLCRCRRMPGWSTRRLPTAGATRFTCGTWSTAAI